MTEWDCPKCRETNPASALSCRKCGCDRYLKFTSPPPETETPTQVLQKIAGILHDGKLSEEQRIRDIRNELAYEPDDYTRNYYDNRAERLK